MPSQHSTSWPNFEHVIPGLGSGCCGLAAQLEGQFQKPLPSGVEPEILALGVPGIGFCQQTHSFHLAHGVMATRQAD